jgi:pyridoxal phosphate enzyme (YggS family)
MPVAENIALVEEKIQKACDSAGRKRDEITLMGVSKFVPVEDVKSAFKAGIRCFGESRVKDGTEKFKNFRNEHQSVRFHLIGSLQRNKAKQAVLFFDCIQSVDRLELADELVKHAHLREEPLEVLLEMHTGEETKRGFQDIDGLLGAAELLMGKKNIKPAGLMTMAPFTEDKEKIRGSFRQLVKARNELEKRFGDNWNCLSMGMSNDFEIAVEEGSTMLRIGSLIFR